MPLFEVPGHIVEELLPSGPIDIQFSAPMGQICPIGDIYVDQKFYILKGLPSCTIPSNLTEVERSNCMLGGTVGSD